MLPGKVLKNVTGKSKFLNPNKGGLFEQLYTIVKQSI